MNTQEKLETISKLRRKASLRGEPVLREASFALLTETVKSKQPKRILEVGTNEGLSVAAMLEAVNTILFFSTDRRDIILNICPIC